MATFPTRKTLFHTPPNWVGSGAVFFITVCCAKRRKNSLAQPDVFNVMTAACHHYAGHGRIWTHLFLAMPDHLHALMSFHDDERMQTMLRDWKRYVAKNTAVEWQDGFFDHRLRGDESFDEKAQYINANPVRAGLITESQIWPYVWTPVDVQAAR